MSRREWCAVIVALASVALCARSAEADAPRHGPATRSARRLAFASTPPRVEVTLAGDALGDPALFARIRSLFSPATSVVLSLDDPLDAGAVLAPLHADAVYVRLRVQGRGARLYLSAREDAPASAARYLVHDVRLDAALDEVGSETLAEIAHSLTEALWRYERQTPKTEVVAALEDDVGVRSSPAGRSASRGADSARAARSQAPLQDAGVTEHSAWQRSSALRALFTIGDAVHAAGDEGLLHEPGVFLRAEFLQRFSLGIGASYLIPNEFVVAPIESPVLVRLRGASGELRAGWSAGELLGARARFEAGVGVLFASWSAALATEDPRARANPSQRFDRWYGLGSVALEWPIGPLRLAARAELRVPWRRTSYEIAGTNSSSSSGGVHPGGGLELGFLFDPSRSR